MHVALTGGVFVVFVVLDVLVDVFDVFIVQFEVVLQVHVRALQVQTQFRLLQFAAQILADTPQVVAAFQLVVAPLQEFVGPFQFAVNVDVEVQVEFIIQVVQHDLLVQAERVVGRNVLRARALVFAVFVVAALR